MTANVYIRGGVIAAAALAIAALLPIMGIGGEPERELRIVAVDRAFYVDGQPQANPTVKLHSGERVKLILRNEDDGMRHDFTIRAWGVAVPAIDGKGERSITFRVPETRGATTYACTPHPASMRGSIEVE